MLQRRMDLQALTLATFEPLVGDAFTLDAGAEQPLDLVLESAAQAGVRPGARDPFSLIFRGPAEPMLPQAIYPLAHAGLGRLDIFVVPIARDDDGVQYQAIFT